MQICWLALAFEYKLEVSIMIRLLGISGSRVKNGNMDALLREAFAQVEKNRQVDTDLIYLAGKTIHPCNHCNWCIGKQSEAKFCTQDDDMIEIYPKLLAADGIILGSPAHFGRLSGLLADVIDRTRAFIHGKVHKLPLKNKIGGAMALSFFRGGGVETTLSSINLFFMCHQMIVANSGLYQMGAGAFTSSGGTGRFQKEPRHSVLEDEYGVAATRLLVDRVVELAHIVQMGQKALQNR
jgi:multimeric flavodoxin WrbA